MKKYLKLAIGIIIIIGIIIAVFYFWQKLNLTEVFFGAKEEQPAAPALKLNALTGASIFDYWVNKKTGIVYYATEKGEIIKLSGETETVVNSQTVNGLNGFIPSKDGAYAIAKFNYPNLPSFSMFDTVTNNWTPLPAKTIAAAWSPNSQEIVYLDDKALKILNLGSQKTREVLKMSQKELNLEWLSESNVILFENPTIELPSTIWSLNIKNKTIVPIIKEKESLMAQWSKDGELAITLHNQNRLPVTSLIDNNGETLAALTFITIPSKCLIESNKIYCAVPQNIKEGIKLPDDYLKKAVYFEDSLYLIDLSTGASKILLGKNDTLIDAEHLELFNNQLLFKNRIDGKLYSLQLE